MRWVAGTVLTIGIVAMLIIPNFWQAGLPHPGAIGNEEYVLSKTFVLQCVTVFFAVMAFFIAVDALKATIRHNDLSALDDYYRELVEQRMHNTALGNFDLTGVDEHVKQQKIEYAYLMFTFIESVMDRGSKNEDVRETWAPLVVSEARRYIRFIDAGKPDGGWEPIHGYDECFREETVHFFKSAASMFIEGHYGRWRSAYRSANPENNTGQAPKGAFSA